MVVDEHRFTVDRAVLTVTPLPWGELSLQMEARGRGDVWHTIIARLFDVRTPGRTLADLDGLVLEAPIGWRDDPDERGTVIDTHQLYVDDHFELVENRVSLARIDDRRMRVDWTASTVRHIKESCREDLRSQFDATLAVDVEDGEFRRLTCVRIEGTEREQVHAVDRVHDLLRPWVVDKASQLVQNGWFDGRSFASVDLVLCFGHGTSMGRPEARPDRMVRMRVPAQVAWLTRREPSDVAAEIQKNIERALDIVADAYPAAPRFLL